MLRERRQEFLTSPKDPKQKYFADMFAIHRFLFEYPALLAGTDLKRITIEPTGVVFTIVNPTGREFLITCDPSDAHSLAMSYLNMGEYEPEETRLLIELINPGDIVLDIGAHIGWHTLNMVTAQPDVQVYSFEPLPASRELLRRNLAQNGQDCTRIRPYGLSYQPGTARFFFDQECHAASSMADLREGPRTIQIDVEMRTLDEAVQNDLALPHVDLIKCDVEGAELLVFKGGRSTIRQFKPIVFAEMLRKWARKFGYHPNDIIDFFKPLGYGCYVIEHGRLQPFDRVDESTTATNYLFLHQEKHQLTISRLSSPPRS